jgi:hypothetical protein
MNMDVENKLLNADSKEIIHLNEGCAENTHLSSGSAEFKQILTRIGFLLYIRGAFKRKKVHCRNS